MSKNDLSWGIIGLGVGEHHLRSLIESKTCSNIAVWDFDPIRLREIATTYPEITICDSETNILGNLDYDGVSICTYDNYHCEQVILALQAGQHVFVEKPVCLSTLELRNIHSTLIRNPSVKLSSNLVLRTSSLFRNVFNRLRQEEFGELFYIEADYYWGRREKFSGWRSKIPYYSIILGAGIHVIDLIMWLVRDRPIEIQAMGNNIATRDTGLQYNSFATVQLRFASGLIARVSANGGAVHPHFHQLKVFGVNQTVIHEQNQNSFITYDERNLCVEPLPGDYPDRGARSLVLQSFLSEISGEGTQCLVPQADVIDVMFACLAAEKAMQLGQTVRVDYS